MFWFFSSYILFADFILSSIQVGLFLILEYKGKQIEFCVSGYINVITVLDNSIDLVVSISFIIENNISILYDKYHLQTLKAMLVVCANTINSSSKQGAL